MMDLGHIHQALLDTHEEALADPRNSAEGLDFASCPPHRQHLATLAAGASAEGMSADAWRSTILEGLGPEARPLLESAESCMRESGLWPWPS
jgi:hypothetical protein